MSVSPALANGSCSGQSDRMAAFECTHLHHAFVFVDDLDAARTFYRDVLGLQEAVRPGFNFDGFWMQVGNEQIHVALSAEPDSKRNHFALEVTDYDAALAHLDAHGVKVRRTEDAASGRRQASLRDPAGNQIEIRPGRP